MRWLLCFLVWPFAALGQTSDVKPHELDLSVSVEDADAERFPSEMVLIKIRGTFRRHITRESLVQPELDGFNWSQLGPDRWFEEQIDGKKVKVFERKMALFPNRSGTIEIGPFIHNLTLTDERDDWFDHQVSSTPISIDVKPLPAYEGWWFPLRSLEISDQWSNAPDQLKSGEGVLRVIRLDALGATPEMIPPMPDLQSPSALIFPHPEKKLTELTPEGPVTYAFWRWTIRPSNDVSTIVEPIEFSFFDTVAREMRKVTISAQRIAYGDTIPTAPDLPNDEVRQATLPGWPAAVAAIAVFVFGLLFVVSGWNILGLARLQQYPLLDPLRYRLRKAARGGDVRELRRNARAIMKRDGPNAARSTLFEGLDRAIFRGDTKNFSSTNFARAFLGKTAK